MRRQIFYFLQHNPMEADLVPSLSADLVEAALHSDGGEVALRSDGNEVCDT
jgi:hypothetical protein